MDFKENFQQYCVTVKDPKIAVYLNIQFDRLQNVPNVTARVIVHITKFQHISPPRIDLHLLPVSFRVEFKICFFLFLSR